MEFTLKCCVFSDSHSMYCMYRVFHEEEIRDRGSRMKGLRAPTSKKKLHAAEEKKYGAKESQSCVLNFASEFRRCVFLLLQKLSLVSSEV